MQHPFWAKTLVNTAFLALSLLCVSCILQDEAENFTHVEQKADAQYRATLLYSYNGNEYLPIVDTLWMSPSEDLYLNFEGPVVYDSKIVIQGDRVISEKTTQHRIQGTDLAIGVNTIQAIQYVKSGTKSLGDIAGAEEAIYIHPLVIIVSNDPPFIPTITSIEVKDGSLQIQWEPYERGDFYSYEIRKYHEYVNEYALHRKLIVTDQRQTSLTDNTYVGDFVPYVLVVNRGGAYYSSEPHFVYIPYEPAFRIEPLGGGRSRLSWDQPPFYKNINSLTISVDLGNHVYEGIAADQTSMEIDYSSAVGRYVYVTMTMRAKVDVLLIDSDQVSMTELVMIGAGSGK